MRLCKIEEIESRNKYSHDFRINLPFKIKGVEIKLGRRPGNVPHHTLP